MRRILVLRHAKSSRDDAGLEDFDRPLAPRGIRDARAMAAYIRESGLLPDAVLCSAALRTVETWRHLAETIGRRATAQIEPELYLADAETLLLRLRRLSDKQRTILLIGHNPGLERLARRLCSAGDAEGRRRMRAKFPTAALAVIDVDIDHWTDLTFGTARLERFVVPRDLD